ncbi:hypothetical protein LMG29542_02315 [Paraburkholderia humisilvae]|uniref:Uncharacterized protein n=1 Tax=Paraburkholderia humisilvae TaxID=627669 RepID=A0A6J5DK49_9BURK|nr:hypothetical protein LMG29542_02315 [Paraburkholderia humisilvae]
MNGAHRSKSPLARHVKHFQDLAFTVVAEVYRGYVNFTLYNIQGWAEGDTTGIFDVPKWCPADTGTSCVEPTQLQDAEIYLHGSVKWDGCSNWHFDEQDRVMLTSRHHRMEPLIRSQQFPHGVAYVRGGFFNT